jgi:serine/threonine-protein kinase haspin
MPVKVVYGKRRNGERQAFTQFFSPEKLESKNAGRNTTFDGRQQPQTTATPDNDAPTKENEFSMLEKRLGSLQIEQTEVARPEGATKTGNKLRKAAVTSNTETAKENVTPIEPLPEKDIDSPVTAIPPKELMVERPGRARKVLSNCNINALKDIESRTAPNQKKERRRLVPTLVTQGPDTHPTNKKQMGAWVSKPALPQGEPPNPLPESEDFYTRYASPLLALSDRKHIVGFQSWSDELEPHFEITKIAEASFSEVYRLSSATTPTSGIKSESVLKVVALKTPPTAPLPSQLQLRAVRDRDGQLEKEKTQREERDQWKSHVEDVLSEVKLLQNLTHIPGFTVFRDLTIVQGRPSTSFNDAWRNWNKSRQRGKKSEFPDPSKKPSYDDTQLWAVVEMQDAGTDCEKIMELGGLTSIWEVWDVFWGVAISVGKAEEACQFEHRDLHLGNICVRSSRVGADILRPLVKDPLRRKLRFTGLEPTVIDYTLSRADVIASPSWQSSALSDISTLTTVSHEKVVDVAFLDLDKDPALFEGDASEEYQYEIYRYMRGAALFNDPLECFQILSKDLQPGKEEENVVETPQRLPMKNTHIRFDSNPVEQLVQRHSPRKHAISELDSTKPTSKQEMGSVWRQFHPKTNLVWLHFLLHKLLNHLSSSSPTPDKLSMHQITQSLQLRDGEDIAKVKKKAMKLWKVLQRVNELLCPVALGRQEGLGSVKELVVLALEEQWLLVRDVAR